MGRNGYTLFLMNALLFQIQMGNWGERLEREGEVCVDTLVGLELAVSDKWTVKALSSYRFLLYMAGAATYLQRFSPRAVSLNMLKQFSH